MCVYLLSLLHLLICSRVAMEANATDAVVEIYTVESRIRPNGGFADKPRVNSATLNSEV